MASFDSNEESVFTFMHPSQTVDYACFTRELVLLPQQVYPHFNSCLSPLQLMFIATSTHVYPYNFKSVLRFACHSHSYATGDFPAACQIGNASGAGREILVKHLLVEEDDFDLLLELEQRISKGEIFSDLAAEYSICPSKQDKGNLGWVRTGQMVPEFEEASFNVPLNKVVRCKTAYGWHLLQVLSEREESLLIDIQPKELHVKMQDPMFLVEAQLIDVREPDELAQAALPGFKNLPLKQLDTWDANQI